MLAAEPACGFEQQHQQQEGEPERLTQLGRHRGRAEASDDAQQQAAQHRFGEAAEAAQNRRRERLQDLGLHQAGAQKRNRHDATR